MTRIHHVFLWAVVIVMVLAAGCNSTTNTAGAPPLVTTQDPAATPVPTAPVGTGTTQPGASGTQAPGTCAANIDSDPANCGGCGYACPANAVCQQGQCFCSEGYTVENNQCVVAPVVTGSGNGCPDGMSPCPDGYCYDLSSSTENCGMCGNMCPADLVCSASTCTNIPADTTTAPVTTDTTTAVTTTTTSSTGTFTTLGPLDMSKRCIILGMTNCGGTCVNLLTNRTNCGTCGHACGALQSCESGICKTMVTVRPTTLVKIAPSLKVVDPSVINPVINPVVNPALNPVVKI